jgi:ABC-type Na+ efflux pump permease subunit
LRKALLIAKWEFKSAVMRRAYLIAVIALPVLFGGIGVVSALTTRSATVGAARTPIALVDKAGLVDLQFAEAQAFRREELRTAATGTPAIAPVAAVAPPAIAPYADLDRALADLSARKVSAIYVVEADYLSTGRITAYSRDAGIFGQPPTSAPTRLATPFARAS